MLHLQAEGGSHGAGQPARIPLHRHRLTVMGRLKPASWVDAADTQFVVLDSPSLKALTSRSHLQITRTRGAADSGAAYELEDLRSMNGVLVNKIKVDRCVLKSGDTVIVGAAKNQKVGDAVHQNIQALSDLVYVFHEDPNAAPVEPAAAAATASSDVGVVRRDSAAPALARSYSFKPSAKSRRSALEDTTEFAGAAAAASSSSAAAADSAAAAASPHPVDSSARVAPKISLANQLRSIAEAPAAASPAADAESDAGFASVPRESAAARRRKRMREEAEAELSAAAAAAASEAAEEKRPRRDTVASPDPVELARIAAELEAKNAAAIESAVAAATAAATAAANAAASSNVAATSKAAATEARQALASELSEEFQCSICCDLLVLATALSCSHTFCRRCVNDLLTKCTVAARSKLTCPNCRAKLDSEPVAVKSLDNAIDRIATTSLTEDERKERKAQQTQDASIVLPKLFEKAAKGKKGRAAAPVPVAVSPAYGGFGAGFGGFPFGGLFGMGAAAAAAPRAVIPEADDEEDDEDYGDEDDDEDDGEGDGAARADIYLEHARSGRSQCRICRSNIERGAVRFGVTERSGYEYYESTQFYHDRCYYPRVNRTQYPRINDIRGYEALTSVERHNLRNLLPDR